MKAEVSDYVKANEPDGVIYKVEEFTKATYVVRKWGLSLGQDNTLELVPREKLEEYLQDNNLVKKEGDYAR